MNETERFDPRCSFCGVPNSIAKDLIAGPEPVYVCHSCVGELAALTHAGMVDEEPVRVDDDAAVWLDPVGGVTLKASDRFGDPVELSPAQARKLASALFRFAILADE